MTNGNTAGMTDTTFSSMAEPKAAAAAPELGVGMLGYAFMGKAHANALKKLPYMMYPPPAVPKLVAVVGRNQEAVEQAAQRYGFSRTFSDWRSLLDFGDFDIFDNGGPNDMHAEPCIQAARSGKHVFCEKPLARTAEEAKAMLDAALTSGVKHMVAFNYRFVPAIVQAKRLIAAGALGKIYHMRAVYLQEWIIDPKHPRVWRLDKKQAGSGTLGDLGAHIFDLARFLVGEPKKVMAMTKTFIPERPAVSGGGTAPVDVDDAFVSLVEFDNGALGTFEASRFCHGRKNYNSFEINGELGTIRFNLERLNELDVYLAGDQPGTVRGFHNVLVTESDHPYIEHWWPHGHIIGWEHTFVHEFYHFFDAIVNKKSVAPWGADFVDGYRNAVICDAVLDSAQSRREVDIRY